MTKMIMTIITNLILSRIDIDKVKEFLGNTPILNMLYKIGAQKLIDYEFPTHIFIETTRACNLGCRSCPRDLGDNKVGAMKFELFKKIVDEATSFGPRNFCLHMFGEPLLHPQIIEMVKYIKDSNRKHSIHLTTNGYFLDEHKSKGLIENGVDKIVVSFFSLRKDRARELTGDGDIRKVVDNVRNAALLKKHLREKTKIFIRFLSCEENKDEERDFRTLAKNMGTLLEIRKTHNYSGIIKNDYTSLFPEKNRYPCYHLWFSPAISWDGKLLLCCNDWNYFEVLGDISKESISSIWQGGRIKELRKLHLKMNFNRIPLCEKCNVWTLYPDIFFKIQKR